MRVDNQSAVIGGQLSGTSPLPAPSRGEREGGVLTDHGSLRTASSSLAVGLHLFYGHPAAREMGFYLAAEWLCRGQLEGGVDPHRAVVVDGENDFDPFVFGDVARRRAMSPDSLLRNLFVSRAFTCHQLQALIVERLVPAIRETHSRMILVLGLLTTFYDEQVPMWEAQRLLRPTLGQLRGLAKGGYMVLLLLPGEPRPSTKRREFLQWTKACADRVLRVEAATGLSVLGSGDRKSINGPFDLKIHLEKPAGEVLDWEINLDPAMQPRKRWQGG